MQETAKDRRTLTEGLSEAREPPAGASLLPQHHSLTSISLMLTSDFNFNLIYNSWTINKAKQNKLTL